MLASSQQIFDPAPCGDSQTVRHCCLDREGRGREEGRRRKGRKREEGRKREGRRREEGGMREGGRVNSVLELFRATQGAEVTRRYY
jgi:hypothetical protein